MCVNLNNINDTGQERLRMFFASKLSGKYQLVKKTQHLGILTDHQWQYLVEKWVIWFIGADYFSLFAGAESCQKPGYWGQ